MDKREFARRLERASERARHSAAQYVSETLPPDLRFILPRHDDPRGRRGPEGTLKYFGGRFIRPEELYLVSSARAADLLWVDGKVPAWVNVNVEAVHRDTTVILMRCSTTLQPADEETLPRDVPYAVDPDDPVEPFRIRGPGVPEGWRSVEQDGRVRLRGLKAP